MVIDHAFYMQLALNEAWKYQALTYPNPPVGALVLDKNGQILSIEAHHEAGTAHAELAAVTEAVKHLGDKQIDTITSPQEKHDYLCKHYKNTFCDATIYVTLEPCMHHGKTPPCSLLLTTLGFSTIVIGTTDPNTEASGAVDYLQKKGHTVITPVCPQSCEALLYPFIRWQNNQNFIFFKLAKFQNGTISGKHVSSEASRKLVHQIRTKIDLLVIGGDTVRHDKPTLDSRMVQSDKAPDILIYTGKDDIDRSIPLFHVPNRNVYIENSFAKLQNYKHIMIEGGEGMLHHTKELTDYYLFFTSPHIREGKKIEYNMLI